MENLVLVDTELDGVTVYKCVGDEDSLEEYISKPGGRRVPGEWSATYTQFNIPHSLGTVGYRWDAGYSSANVIRVVVSTPIKCIIADAPFFVDGSVGGDEKANALRLALGLEEGVPLMQAIGNQGKVLICRETETQWELIIPHNLPEPLICDQQVVMQLKPNMYGATGQARIYDEEKKAFSAFRRCDDTEALREEPEPKAILQALRGSR